MSIVEILKSKGTGELKIGDYVKTCFSHPLAPVVRYEIEEIREIAGELHGCGKKGSYPIRLLKKIKKPK